MNPIGTSGCAVTRCTLVENVGYGLYADADCAVSHCVARGTTGTGVGLRVGDNSSVTGCTASANAADGIQLTNRCHATNNNAVSATNPWANLQ
jgi:parallel beta-helix repeat protein